MAGNLYLWHEEQMRGPYSEEEVLCRLKQGIITEEVLAASEGDVDWQPLRLFMSGSDRFEIGLTPDTPQSLGSVDAPMPKASPPVLPQKSPGVNNAPPPLPGKKISADDPARLVRGTVLGFLLLLVAVMVLWRLLRYEEENGQEPSFIMILIPVIGVILLGSCIFCLLRLWRAQRLRRYVLCAANFVCLLPSFGLLCLLLSATSDWIDKSKGRPTRHQRDTASAQNKRAQRIAEIDGVLAAAKHDVLQLEAAMGMGVDHAQKFCNEFEARQRKDRQSVTEDETVEYARLNKLFMARNKILNASAALYRERDQLEKLERENGETETRNTVESVTHPASDSEMRKPPKVDRDLLRQIEDENLAMPVPSWKNH